MRDYSKVGPMFWIGATGKRLRAAGMESQIVAMYLLTSPHSNMLGLYYCPIMFIAHETGLGLEGASKGLKGCFEAGFCEYDPGSEVVWVIEMASYQVGESLKPTDLRTKGVQNEYSSLPENPYLERFFEKYGESFCMTQCRKKTSPFEAPCKPLRSQEQEKEQEKEKEVTPPVSPPAGGEPPSGGKNGKRPSRAKRGSGSLTFGEWVAVLKTRGEKPVTDYAAVWQYATDVGLPEDWIQLAWMWFKDRYSVDEKGSRKRYTDWRRVFLRAVKEGWPKYWFWSDRDNCWRLTTAGVQADIETRDAA